MKVLEYSDLKLLRYPMPLEAGMELFKELIAEEKIDINVHGSFRIEGHLSSERPVKLIRALRRRFRL